jgi:hypothetical protein
MLLQSRNQCFYRVGSDVSTEEVVMSLQSKNNKYCSATMFQESRLHCSFAAESKIYVQYLTSNVFKQHIAVLCWTGGNNVSTSSHFLRSRKRCVYAAESDVSTQQKAMCLRSRKRCVYAACNVSMQ